MDNNDPLQRTIDAWVHTPIGLALMAARTVPGLVNEVVSRGCAQVGEAEANLRKAQMIGQVAVGFGTAWLRSQLDPTGSKPAPAGAGSDPDRGRPATTPTRKPPARKPAPPRRDATPKTAPAPPGLAIPAYDGLSAQQVVARLGGLTEAELRAVRRHEAAGRARKTVLAAVDRLLP